jgi:hypothetical protein
LGVAPHPLEIANIVGRNIVPIVGVLFFGWSAGNLLLLYFLDTMLVIAVMCAGLASYFSPPGDNGVTDRISSEVGYVMIGLFLAAFIAIPLGMPLGIFLATSNFSFRGLLDDHGFRLGLLVQGVAAVTSYVGLYRALKSHTPDQLNLKRRFALVFLRWMVVVMVAYFPFIYFFGQYASLVFVAIYVGTTIFIEIAPDRFLRAMPGGAANLR